MNTQPREWYVSQAIALFMVIFGAVCIGIGCKYQWEAMKTAGAGISGAGIQAITSQIRQSLTNKEGGTINLNTPEQSANPTQ